MDAALATTARYTGFPGAWGGLKSMRRDGVSSFYGMDLQDTVRALISAAETVTDGYVLTAFGEEVWSDGTTVNPFRFEGVYQYYRDVAERLYVRARYYSSRIDRWLARDPLFLSAPAAFLRLSLFAAARQAPRTSRSVMGPRRQRNAPGTIRAGCVAAYLYVDNCPISLIDPSGLLCQMQDCCPDALAYHKLADAGNCQAGEWTDCLGKGMNPGDWARDCAKLDKTACPGLLKEIEHALDLCSLFCHPARGGAPPGYPPDAQWWMQSVCCTQDDGTEADCGILCCTSNLRMVNPCVALCVYQHEQRHDRQCTNKDFGSQKDPKTRAKRECEAYCLQAWCLFQRFATLGCSITGDLLERWCDCNASYQNRTGRSTDCTD